MFTINIQDDITPLIEGLSHSVGTIMQDVVKETSEVMTPYVKQNAPIGKRFLFDGTELPGGQLRDSLHFTIGEFGSYLTGASTGLFVIGGTRPHEITPKARPMLAFFWPRVGHGVLRKRVNHPGTKANDFRWKAVQEAFDEMAVQDVCERLMTEWVTRGGG